MLESVEVPTVERPPVPAHLLAARRQEETPKPGTRKAVFPISEGDVSLTFPEDISGAGLKSLKRYLEIFLDEQIEGAPIKPN